MSMKDHFYSKKELILQCIFDIILEGDGRFEYAKIEKESINGGCNQLLNN